DDPVKVPRASSINTEQEQSAGIGKKACEQRHAHQRMQLLAPEHPGRNADCKGTGAERGQHHHVKGLPDSPAKSVVHSADWPQTRELTVAGQQERHQGQRHQHQEKPRYDRESKHGHCPLPPVFSFELTRRNCAHSCALKPVSFSCSCASSTCPFTLLRITCTKPAYNRAGSAKYW